MPAKKYVVTLSDEERSELQGLVSKGKAAAHKLMHARVLLKADSGGDNLTDEEIAKAVESTRPTVERVRRRFVEEGIEAALNRRKLPPRPPKVMDGTAEASLVALACSRAPQGYARWTLRLLADQMVQLQYVDHISHETVRQTLKKTW